MSTVDTLESENTLLRAQVHSLSVALQDLTEKVIQLEKEKKQLRQNCVSLQVSAEQEEENISNTLLKKIRDLEIEKKLLEEKGLDAQHLTRKIQVLQKEKVDLENALEQESESVVNKLNKEKSQLEQDKHLLETQLQHCPAHHKLVMQLSSEVMALKELLAQRNSSTPSKGLVPEEVQSLKEEVKKYKRKLFHAEEKIHTLETEKLNAQSSHELDEERQFNIARSQSPSIPMHQPSSFSSRSMSQSPHPTNHYPHAQPIFPPSHMGTQSPFHVPGMSPASSNWRLSDVNSYRSRTSSNASLNKSDWELDRF